MLTVWVQRLTHPHSQRYSHSRKSSMIMQNSDRPTLASTSTLLSLQRVWSMCVCGGDVCVWSMCVWSVIVCQARVFVSIDHRDKCVETVRTELMIGPDSGHICRG